MDITYCCESCSIGKAASEKFLASNNSAFDAAIDFQYFVEDCYKSCTCCLQKDLINTGAQLNET